MKKLIAVTALVLAGCTASPPSAPAVPVAAPDPNSCEARHDRTPCILTNQQALIEILQLSQTNVLYPDWKQPRTWQEMLVPPEALPSRPASITPQCPACAEGIVWAKDAVK